VSVLLRQPHGFEGGGAILEIILPDHQASAQGKELKVRLADGYAATRSMPAQLDRDEKAVSEIEQLLWIEANVLEALKYASPNLQVAVMAVIDRIEVDLPQLAGVVLDARIKAGEEEVEVPATRRRVTLPKTSQQQHPAEAGVLRKSRPPRRPETRKRREADDDPFIQGPVPPRFRYERDADTAHGLDGLLRHRPRSIPQAQESA
jgi:hypothetical protein